MRQRLTDRRAVDYQVRRDNFTWLDHILRVQLTAGLIAWMTPDTVCDPACGDGTIVAAAHHIRPIAGAYLADISRPNFYHVGTAMREYLPTETRVACQPIEETLREPNFYDMVVLTEILEHVEDPVAILRLAHDRSRTLVASSPMIRPDQIDDNAEHLWQFDVLGYREMLEEAGWEPLACVPASLFPSQFIYDFQIWGAVSV